MYEYNIIVPTSWKTITLKEKLKKGGKTNSDTDSLTDWQEVLQDKIKVDEHGEIVLPIFNLNEAMENIERYDDNGTYDFLRNDKRNIPYLPIKSDPTDEDTDDDSLLDDEDRDPQKVFLNDLLIKLKLMEKYIDEYIILKDYSTDKYINSNIVINILRNYEYGTDAYNFSERPLKWLVETGKWTYTNGTNYPNFRNYINNRDASVLIFLKNYKFYDNNNNIIDFLHLCTTLAAERHNSVDQDVDPNLAGWAGDLQSLIFNLREINEESDSD